MTVLGYVIAVDAVEQGSTTIAPSAASATTLAVDDPTPFRDPGGIVDVLGVRLTYTSVTEDPATGNGTITLATPLATAVDEASPVWVVLGGEVAVDYIAHVALGGDGAFDAQVIIPFEQRDKWPLGQYDVPVQVVLSDDLAVIIETPGRVPVIGDEYIADELRGKTITGSLFRTGEDGKRWEMGSHFISGGGTWGYDSNELIGFSGDPSETAPGKISVDFGSVPGGLAPVIDLLSGETGGDHQTTTWVTAGGGHFNVAANLGVRFQAWGESDGEGAFILEPEGAGKITLTAAEVIIGNPLEEHLEVLSPSAGQVDLLAWNNSGSADLLRIAPGTASTLGEVEVDSAGALTGDAARLGKIAKEAPTSWNNATLNGWWIGTNLSNGPLATGKFLVRVLAESTSNLVQIATQLTTGATNTWRRDRVSGTWGSWQRLGVYNSHWRTTDVSVAHNTWSTVPFPTGNNDPEFTGTTTFTIPCTGRYSIVGQIAFRGNATGRRSVRLNLNAGTIVLESEPNVTSAGTGPHCLPFSGVFDLAAGDTIEVQAFQTSGAGLSLAGTQSQTFVNIDRIR